LTTTIYLVRHGDVHNPERILYGRIPGFRLSDLGQEQARAAAEDLAIHQPKAIYASPQQRAQETARFIAAHHPHLTVSTEQRLDEVHSPHEGRPLEEMEAIQFDLYSGNQPPYESALDVRDRALTFIQAARQAHPRGTVIGVTHGDVVTFAFLYFSGVDVAIKDRLKLEASGISDGYPATASITRLTFQTDDPDERPQPIYHRPY
jgi:broad specificity phosphatase PhoE